ncbi:HAMP domain-containing sensor histidine kinase [Sphingomonas sp. SUN039]|uniref:sensor histidine kinase n=1 Tax=Sphingomonas sp. SUN039 TaxID=2937787 RepID=UPI002164B9FA|nr:ATP-binding protein [Sphingomonas sp. SUN039]UVO53748.1 ATP-binding protein [Sphingomonas sp. SUN039]
MRRGWADSLWRSTSFRLAVIQAGFLLLAVAGASVAMFVITRGVAERELRSRITLESSAVISELTGEGIGGAAAAVRWRALRPGALEYLLTDSAGRRLAGDLPDTNDIGWHRLSIRNHGENSELLVYSVSVPGGARLTVGDDLAPARDLADALLRSLLFWGGLALLLGLGLGVWATRHSLARMDALGRTLEDVSAGDLLARVPTHTGRGDDLDVVGIRVNAMLDRIALLVQAQRRVSADVAHELRSPLTLLRQRIGQAASARTASDRTVALEAADAAIDDALRLFEAMLRLSEIEAGSARQRFAMVDLGERVELITDAYRADIEAAGRTLETSFASGAIVTGDADLLGLAVSNLLENAIKHTPPGAKVVVRVSIDHGTCILTFEDRGSGMAEEEFARVVEPFARLDAARSTSGAGLGLAIVAAVMRLHDATFERIDSASGLHLVCRFLQRETQ